MSEIQNIESTAAARSSKIYLLVGKCNRRKQKFDSILSIPSEYMGKKLNSSPNSLESGVYLEREEYDGGKKSGCQDCCSPDCQIY